jgi:tRNA (guanine-N7-)-methyltransferase
MQTLPSSIYVPSNWVARLDWGEVFGNAQPVEVDIGCGKGSFLLWSAQTRATTNIVGVDRLLRRLRKIDRKVQRIGLPNVRLIRVEASYLVGFLVPEASVAAYHVYFPDPWPKRRHHQRRLIGGAFLSDLHRTLCEGGVVNCATDDVEYFQWIQQEFYRIGEYAETEAEVLPEAGRTDFERDFLATGTRFYRCRWVKK